MIDVVCYLVPPATGAKGLVFPTEVDEHSRSGVGAFYLLGTRPRPLRPQYIFHAVHGEAVVTTRLARYRDTKSYYQVTSPTVGRFLFYAQPLSRRLTYIGTDSNFRDMFVVRRLRSWHPNELDAACRHHQFYFVGYSPGIGTDGPG